MSNNDNGVFADDEFDDGGALDALRARLRAERDAPTTLDLAAQRAHYDERGARMSLPAGWSVSAADLGRPAELLTGPGAKLTHTILYFHGGGFRFGSLASHRGLAAQIGQAAQAEIFTLDYRLAPENPFPAAVEDGFDAYKALLDGGRTARSIVLAGDSAGGGLAFSVALMVKARGLPTPLGIVAISPWTDLSMSGDSIMMRAEADPTLVAEGLRESASAYLGGAETNTPLASPLFADLAGLPPLLIHIGSDDILLSDSERFVTAARKAGVDATVEIWPGLFHVWHKYFDEIEEGREGISEIGAWLKRRWK